MLRFCDSFDHYTTALALAKGWSLGSTSINASGGRNSTASLRSGNTNFPATLTLPGAYNAIILGFSYKNTLPGFGGIVNLRNGSDYHLQFRQTSGGFIEVLRGTGGTVLATGTHQLAAGATSYIEIKAFISDTVGTVEVLVNEVSDINISGQDTKNAGTSADINNLQFFFDNRTVGGLTMDIDDLYVCDTTGGVNDDFLGDVRVEAILPGGNGTTSNLTGSDGNSTDNYLLVDEASPDDDTTYVESSTVTNKDTYAYGNLTPTSGTVMGVQILAYARKTDAGVRSIATVARHSGTEVDSSDHTLGTSYAYHRDIRETKPGGGTWSISDVNGAEFGVKVTA